MDRFGPRMDRGNNFAAAMISKEMGENEIDLRFYTKNTVVSYIGVGGSDWATRIECDFGIQALTPMWKVIDNVNFQWSKSIVMEDEKVAVAHKVGENLANAAKDFDQDQFQSEEGVWPHCHSKEFYLTPGSGKDTCCLCGIEGKLELADGVTKFVFPEEQLAHAHDTMSGKKIHADDIQRNEGRLAELQKTDEFKRRKQAYIDFIAPVYPE